MPIEDALPKPLQTDTQLCFIHIVKTAGSTLTSILDEKFPVEQISPHPRQLWEVCPDASKGMSSDELAHLLTRYRLIRDHFSYREVCPYLKNPRYLTVLRHPLERTLSFYTFIRRSPAELRRSQHQQSRATLKQAASGSLLEFVCHPDPTVQRSIANHQLHRILPPIADLEHRSDEERLAIAQQTLEQFLWVGLTERFQESVLLLNDQMGWYPAAQYASLKVAPHKPKSADLPPETIEAILQRNQLDLALYEFANQLLDARLSRMMAELSGHDAPLTPGSPELLTQLERRYQQQSLPRQREIEFDFTQSMQGAGWHRRNGDLNGLKPVGSCFRWMADPTATLDFSLHAETDLTIRFRVVNAVSAEVLDSLQLRVNGQPIALVPLQREPLKAVFEGRISQSAIASNAFTRLTFTVAQTAPLPSVNLERSAAKNGGVAIDRLQLFPVNAERDRAQCLALPTHDPHWQGVADWLQTHISADDRIAAPLEFRELWGDRVFSNAEPFAQMDLNWVVLHKSRLSTVEPASLKWAIAQLRPVWANEVFVVFAADASLPIISPLSRHLRPVWHYGWTISDRWRERIGVLAIGLRRLG